MTQHAQEQESTLKSSKGGEGPPPGTIAIVDVLASTKPDGSTEFTHTWHWQGGPDQGNGAVTIPQKGEKDPDTPIHFNLTDDTKPKLNWVFTDDVKGPIFVQRNSCPPDDQYCMDPQIYDVKTGPQLVKIMDKNTEKCELHYRLRFKDKSGRSDSYDPIIDNGGKN